MILLETDDYIIINKPPNVSSQGGKDTKANVASLVNLYLLKDKQQIKHNFTEQATKDADIDQMKCYIIQRLDKGTSGCMVICKTQEASQQLSSQFSDRKVAKTYLAFCYGIPKYEGAEGYSYSGRIKTNLEFNASTLK